MSQTYDWYFAALANPKQIGRTPELPVHESEPQPGFYRKRRGKEGPWDAVAIWLDEGALVAAVGEKMVDPHDVWTWCCRQPVSEEAYRAARDTGTWADEPPPRRIGDNSGSTDPFEALQIEYAGEKEQADEFLRKPVTTQADADKAAVWAKRLADISKKATDLHKVEKQPSLDESRRVDEKWRDLKEGPKDMSTRLKRHIDGFLREQDRLERERQRIAQEDARRREEDAEAARRAAESSDDEEQKAEAARLEREAEEAEREARARNSTAGRTGARVALRTFVLAEITDFDALLMALKDRAEVRDLVQSLANRAAKGGVELPGMKITEDRRAA